MVGHSVMELARERKKKAMQDAGGSAPSISLTADGEFGNEGQFVLSLKKKRANALLKKMLEDAGYKDLARMTKISRERIDE